MEQKSSGVVTIVAVIAAVVLLWLAWQGFALVRWRIRYMAPAFMAGLVLGSVGTWMLTRRR